MQNQISHKIMQFTDGIIQLTKYSIYSAVLDR